MTAARPSLPLALASLLLLGCGATGTSTRVYDWPKDLKVATNLHAAWRAVDHPVFDGHPVAAAELVGYRVGAPAALEVGASYATEDLTLAGTEIDGHFSEGYAGLRKIFGEEGATLRPYLGLGGQYMRIARREASGGITRSADEWGAGGYLRGGLTWSLGRIAVDGGTELLLGIDVRAVASEDADFVQAGVFLGFGR